MIRTSLLWRGAGSGKTRVLVERYLSLLEAHPNWSLNSLVAITFTRAAALEMRDRVRQEIEQRLDGEDGARWSRLLSQMDSARIDTIHALCTTILKANAAEAGIDPTFEVLDETEAAILIEVVIDDVLQSMDSSLVELFSEYDIYAIRDVLARPDLLATPLTDLPDDLMKRWQDEWHDHCQSTIEQLCGDKTFQAAVQWSLPVDVDPSDKLLGVWQKVYAQAEVLFRGDSLEERLSALQDLASSQVIKLNVGGASAWGGKETIAEAKAVLRHIREQAHAAIDLIGSAPNELDERAAQLLPQWYHLFTLVQKRYAAAKAEQGQLDFNDLEQLTARLLESHAEVRKRYRQNEFRHLLVDEFQDTNQVQWSIIQQLADSNIGGTFFLVGDPKQSIYAFRGADVSVFNHVQEEIEAHPQGRSVSLVRSFRTHHHLIEQFNSLFSTILIRDEQSAVAQYQVEFGKPMDAYRQSEFDAATLEFLLLDKTKRDADGEPIRKGNNSFERYTSEELRRWEAYELARRFQAMIHDGVLVWDKGLGDIRPITYGDCAILFQTMRHVGLYEDVFKALNIPYVTLAGRGYYSRQEVWDLLNLLRALHNANDNLSLAAVLRSPIFGLSDNVLFALRLLHDENGQMLSLWDALHHACENAVVGVSVEEQARIRFCRGILDDLKAIAGRVTISELLREALAKTGYLAILTGLPDGVRRRGNVEKLIEIARQSGKITLGAFTHYLEDLSERELREGEVVLEAEGAVQLMSVHASKGLEFPLVVLADAGWVRRSSNRDIVEVDSRGMLSCKVWDEVEAKHVMTYCHQRHAALHNLREEAERKRLLYVAATRAQDYLLVSGSVSFDKQVGWKASGWLDMLLGVCELRDTDFLDAQTCEFGGHQLGVRFPMRMPDEAEFVSAQMGQPSLWDADNESDILVQEPYLMRDIVVAPSEQFRHLTATQLADIGQAHQFDKGEYYRRRFQNSVLHDAPASIPDIVRQYKPRVRQRTIGEIMHEALRYWRFPDNTEDIRQALRGYAWQQGLTHPRDIAYAIKESQKLLERFQRSEMYEWLAEARSRQNEFYSEIPFIYKTDKRILHGVIDVLFKRGDDWIVLDYKTSYVPNTHLGYDVIDDHAQRFDLQVGAYAAAVSSQLGGITPRVYIHYIRYTHDVEIPTERWQQALYQLEDTIGQLIGAQ